jgi:hypothetical protein
VVHKHSFLEARRLSKNHREVIALTARISEEQQLPAPRACQVLRRSDHVGGGSRDSQPRLDRLPRSVSNDFDRASTLAQEKSQEFGGIGHGRGHDGYLHSPSGSAFQAAQNERELQAALRVVEQVCLIHNNGLGARESAIGPRQQHVKRLRRSKQNPGLPLRESRIVPMTDRYRYPQGRARNFQTTS